MEKLLHSLIYLAMIAIMAGCGNDEPDPAPVPDPVSRTILVYMVADNNLSTDWDCDKDDLDEMVMAASTTGFNGGRLIVYYGRFLTENGETLPPRLLEVTAGGLKELKSYSDDRAVYSVDPSRMSEVMADMKSFAPADDYGLVMWSHANGWLGPVNPDDNRYRSFGDDRGHHITLPTLYDTLKDERFRFIYFDCCLMGNVETVWELRSLAPVIIASPTELGIEGMPYDENLECLFAKTPLATEAAANTMNWYESRNRPCQMTVIQTSGLERLARTTRDILATVTSYPEDVTSMQRYVIPGERCWSYDMDDYMTLLAGEESGLLAEWRDALAGTVIYCATTTLGIGNLRMERYCGLGMHAPRNASELTYRGYDTLAWWRDVASTCPAYKD